MRIYYNKIYKWLLSQNQRVRNGFFGYRRYEALAKHVKPLEVSAQTKTFERLSRQTHDPEK